MTWVGLCTEYNAMLHTDGRSAQYAYIIHCIVLFIQYIRQRCVASEKQCSLTCNQQQCTNHKQHRLPCSQIAYVTQQPGYVQIHYGTPDWALEIWRQRQATSDVSYDWREKAPKCIETVEDGAAKLYDNCNVHVWRWPRGYQLCSSSSPFSAERTSGESSCCGDCRLLKRGIFWMGLRSLSTLRNIVISCNTSRIFTL